jgi:hypothetical protein
MKKSKAYFASLTIPCNITKWWRSGLDFVWYYTKKQMLRAERQYQWPQKKKSIERTDKVGRKPKGKTDSSNLPEPQQ